MEIKIDVPEYGKPGFKYQWEDNTAIRCNIEGSQVIIEANQDGLISLARHLLEMAQDNVPHRTHIHLDEFNSLEEGSSELIIVKNAQL